MTRNSIAPIAHSSIRPFEPFGRIFDDPFFAFGPIMSVGKPTPHMALDVKETDEGYVVEADLPGINKEDISISLEDDIMTIAYEKNEEEKEEKDGYVVRERKSHVAMKRSVAVPGADETSAKASMEDGVLKIEISKTPVVETKKTIEIS